MIIDISVVMYPFNAQAVHRQHMYTLVLHETNIIYGTIVT